MSAGGQSPALLLYPEIGLFAAGSTAVSSQVRNAGASHSSDNKKRPVFRPGVS
jgi:hypothetical protein